VVWLVGTLGEAIRKFVSWLWQGDLSWVQDPWGRMGPGSSSSSPSGSFLKWQLGKAGASRKLGPLPGVPDRTRESESHYSV
jgi:hypothetical protein